MSITDELRRWVGIYEHEVDYMLTSRQATQLLEIADRIDVQAEKESEAAWRRGYERGEDEAKFEDLDELRKEVQADWIPLPVDADGKVIHVEDEVELLDGSSRFKAEWLEWDGEDWAVHETIGYGAYHEPSSLRHVQPDTWERIIEDTRVCLLSDYKTEVTPTMRWKSDIESLVERCRRLAGAE